MAFTYSLPGGCNNHSESCDPLAALPRVLVALAVVGLLAWRAHRVISKLDSPDARPVGFFTWCFLVSVVVPVWKLNRTSVLAYAVQFHKRLPTLLAVGNAILLLGLVFARPFPPGFLATFALVLPAANAAVAIGPIAIAKAIERKGWSLPYVSFWRHQETWLT